MTAARERQPIRTETDTIDNVVMFGADILAVFAGGDIPDADVSSIPTCERQPIRTETYAPDITRVEGVLEFARGNIP